MAVEGSKPRDWLPLPEVWQLAVRKLELGRRRRSARGRCGGRGGRDGRADDFGKPVRRKRRVSGIGSARWAFGSSRLFLCVLELSFVARNYTLTKMSEKVLILAKRVLNLFNTFLDDR